MANVIMIPTVLRKFTGGKDKVKVNGRTISLALLSLADAYPALKTQIYDDDGKMRNFVNIFLNDEDVRYLDGEDTEIKDSDVISIVPSIAGGL